MTEQDLRQALSEYGNVVSVRILRDQQKQSRGVGFARMNDRRQCQEIIDQFHNKTFPSLFSFLSNKTKSI
jgi:RNA recognition motif-containing protein